GANDGREKDEERALPGLDGQGCPDLDGRGRLSLDGDALLRWTLVLLVAGGPGIGGRERLLDEGGELGARKGSEREAQADGAIALEQEEVPAPEDPALARPACVLPRERHDKADRDDHAPIEDPGEAAALLGVVEIGAERVNIDGQRGFVLEKAPRVLEGR